MTLINTVRPIIAATVLVIIASFSFAEEGKGMDDHDKMDKGDRLSKMVEYLDLTESQQTQIKAIMEESREKMKALHEDMRAQMAEILTPDQLEKMEKKKSEREETKDKKKKY